MLTFLFSFLIRQSDTAGFVLSSYNTHPWPFVLVLAAPPHPPIPRLQFRNFFQGVLSFLEPWLAPVHCWRQLSQSFLVISWCWGCASGAGALAKPHALRGGAGCLLGFSAAWSDLPSVAPSSAHQHRISYVCTFKCKKSWKSFTQPLCWKGAGPPSSFFWCSHLNADYSQYSWSGVQRRWRSNSLAKLQEEIVTHKRPFTGFKADSFKTLQWFPNRHSSHQGGGT